MISIRTLCSASVLLLVSCATGGEEERDISEVKIQASHFLYGLGGNRSIIDFPIPKSAIGTDLGVLTMTDTSEYSIDRSGNQSAFAGYSLAMDGTLNITVPISGSSPTRFVGAYRDAAAGSPDSEAFYFTDRFAPTNGPVVGLFWGVPQTSTDGDFLGGWFLFSQHVIFARTGTGPAEREIGRTVVGEVDISATGVVTGTGFESTNDNITFTGTAIARSNGGFDFDTLDFRKGVTSDLRTIRMGQNQQIALGVDEVSTRSSAGLVAMMRRFDPLDNSAIVDAAGARAALAGTYQFGMHTIFVKPLASGIDAANGTIVFTAAGGWTLEGVGSKGPTAGRFSYGGTYSFEVDPANAAKLRNRIILKVDGPPSETWTAAVDPSYSLLIIADNDAENRSPDPDSPELNLALAIRRPQ